jgi:hypothetical protein
MVWAKGTTTEYAATGRLLTNAQSLDVSIVDGSGNQITSFSGGTQYVNGSPAAPPTGTVAMGFDGTDVWALPLDVTTHYLQVDLKTPIPAGANNIGSVELIDSGGVNKATIDATGRLDVAVSDGAGHTQPAGDAVTRPIITEITDGTNILGTVSHPLQVAQAGGGSSVTLSANTTYIFTRVLVNITTSGSTTVIAGVGGQTLRIYRFVLVFGTAVTVTLQDTAANTLFPATMLVTNSTMQGEFDTQPKFPIALGNGFIINLGSTSTVTGFIDYTQS